MCEFIRWPSESGVAVWPGDGGGVWARLSKEISHEMVSGSTGKLKKQTNME